METNINFSLRKLTPMKYKNKINHKKMNNFFIKINEDDENMYNLKDMYDIVEFGNKINPITKEVISNENINKIRYLYNNIIEVELDKCKDNHKDNDENKLLIDSLEVFENQIEELYNYHEQNYSLLQEHQHLLEKIKSKIDNE